MMWNGPFGGGWDGWGWLWPIHFIFPLLFWALIITAVVMLVRYATGWHDHSPLSERRRSSLDILEGRYARGEINRDEYLEKKKDIVG